MERLSVGRRDSPSPGNPRALISKPFPESLGLQRLGPEDRGYSESLDAHDKRGCRLSFTKQTNRKRIQWILHLLRVSRRNLGCLQRRQLPTFIEYHNQRQVEGGDVYVPAQQPVRGLQPNNPTV